MHNWLIFLYHRVRANPNGVTARGLSSDEPGPVPAGSNGATQEGKSTRALVVPG